MKNVILLHGRWPEKIDGKLIADISLCDSNNPGNWMGWTKNQLEMRGYVVVCPIVKEAWKARWDEWKEALDRVEINEETIFVGHSAGGYAVLRYLGETGKKVRKVILIAPGAPGMERDDSPLLPYEEEFYTYDIPPALTVQISEGVTVFVSNDWDFILRAVEYYKRKLDATVISLENRGHFSFLIKELPELLNEILIIDSKPESKETHHDFESQF
ncbi:alpha/beta hydrolase [Candidatus Uhrbacteria bacterium]|nr:alpha/beta hydrolase [Candidatus Uhrbacteria bacterium]